MTPELQWQSRGQRLILQGCERETIWVERPYRIPLGNKGLCALFLMPVLLSVTLLCLASWQTLAFTGCTLGEQAFPVATYTPSLVYP